MSRTTSPRRRKAKAHTSVSCRVADAERLDAIAQETGLRKDAIVTCLMNLYRLAPEGLRLAAGFPCAQRHDAAGVSDGFGSPVLSHQPRGVASARSEATTPGCAGTPAHDARTPTTGAAA